ncbi:copper amine oxidase N-terminal domain-containing protein [Paenibacillus hamazuiensis]|uniref:copper amine oxidase N-terminal domain-containing protein n=1 Tax=Paenibacillus hamazuiensis TaxID=2936508 RepID=UPI00200F6489|nr:copper amine oxidase N-terminal domain-containing protein [Paenibacillus hamazuiensis]
MRKRIWRIAALSSLLATTFTAGVYAEDILRKVDAYLRPDYNIVLDGKPVKLEHDTLIYDGSSYLPIKELGNLLGASILFKGETKTIYINSRMYEEQPITNPDYEEIVMSSPNAGWYNYLGAEYPALTIYNEKASSGTNNKYWRLKDVKRMGMDLTGLPIVKEKYTQDLYVSEQELRKKNNAPVSSNGRNRGSYVVTGETNPNKIEAIQTHIKNTLNAKIKNVSFSNRPIIVDALPEENTYDYLFYQNGYWTDGTRTNNRLIRVRLSLRFEMYDKEQFTVNAGELIDLQSQAALRESQSKTGSDSNTDTQQ